MNRGELVAVYGSLRKGLHNHVAIMSCARHVDGFVEGFSMYDLGMYPAVSMEDPKTQTEVLVELYEIKDEATSVRLDRLEGYPHYYNRKLTKVKTTLGDKVAWIYYQKGKLNLPVVEKGDWKRYVEETKV